MSTQVASPSLFLGFLVDPSFTRRLAQASPSVVALITQGGDAYLESYLLHKKRYLGKRLGTLTDIAAIESTEKNIQSLVERMIPNEQLGMPPLILLALPS